MSLEFKSTWHFLHLIMCLLTGGLWIPIWIWRTLANSNHNSKLKYELLRNK